MPINAYEAEARRKAVDITPASMIRTTSLAPGQPFPVVVQPAVADVDLAGGHSAVVREHAHQAVDEVVVVGVNVQEREPSVAVGADRPVAEERAGGPVDLHQTNHCAGDGLAVAQQAAGERRAGGHPDLLGVRLRLAAGHHPRGDAVPLDAQGWDRLVDDTAPGELFDGIIGAIDDRA